MATSLTTTREERGETIAKLSNQIQRADENFYTVKSQSGNGKYAVTKVDDEWLCECPDNKYRKVKCKHIFAVEFSKSFRAEVAVTRVIREVNVNVCKFCGSERIVKNAVRRNLNGHIQKYKCKVCGRQFSINLGFEKVKATPQIVTSAMQLYFTGESLRNVQKFLKLQGVTVEHTTVLRWIRKYVKLMNSYLEQIQPNVSDTWRADELYVKIKGDLKYLFAVMDDETRFWIAQEVAETKDQHDARTLFSKAKYLMGKAPKTIVTDGLRTYSRASQEVYPLADHVKHIRLQGDMNNNKMERMNGEVRDREKVMRGLKKVDTPILKGYQIFHNYIRPHESLEGKTPSEVCGIIVQGQNKWITLIQNAVKQNRSASSDMQHEGVSS
ncbi:MAG: IS6 family transposase [Candidatus Bathyarchaeia archaeon]